MKRCSAEEAVKLIRPVDSLCLGFGPAQPCSLLESMSNREDWEDLTALDFLAPPNGLYATPAMMWLFFQVIFVASNFLPKECTHESWQSPQPRPTPTVS